MIKYSVLVVTLNSGEDLRKTINSILSQSYKNLEIIVKDGGSCDKSLDQLPQDTRIKIISERDCGIYDAMNQAVDYANGDFILFMNTGDIFFDDLVLENVNKVICNNIYGNTIFYGDCYTVNRNVHLKYPERISDYVCFTMVLCHQATLYPCYMLKERKFDLHYTIAADYEYYVHRYVEGCNFVHLPVTIVRYLGDGASEQKENRIRNLYEANKIRKKYFNGYRYIKSWLLAQLHGAGLKQLLLRQEWFYPFYKKMASWYYKI